MNGAAVDSLRGAIERAQEAGTKKVVLHTEAPAPGAVVFIVDGGVCRGRVRSVRVEVDARLVSGTLLEVRVLDSDGDSRIVVRRKHEVFASASEAAIAAFIDPEPAL